MGCGNAEDISFIYFFCRFVCILVFDVEMSAAEANALELTATLPPKYTPGRHILSISFAQNLTRS